MSNRGNSRSQKSISAPIAVFLKRKENVWTIKTSAGPHSKETSVPLGFVVRDMLSLSETMFETKKVLNEGAISVNGVTRREPKFPIGLFDVVSTKDGKNFRLVFDTKGRLVLSEMGGKSALEKVSKILFKKIVKKGLVQLTTTDGFVFREKKTEFKPGDSLRISLPDKKILEGLELKKGNMVYFTSGKKLGHVGKVTGFTEGTRARPRLVSVDVEGTEVLTVAQNVFVVGKNSLSIDFGDKFKEGEL